MVFFLMEKYFFPPSTLRFLISNRVTFFELNFVSYFIFLWGKLWLGGPENIDISYQMVGYKRHRVCSQILFHKIFCVVFYYFIPWNDCLFWGISNTKTPKKNWGFRRKKWYFFLMEKYLFFPSG